MQAKLSTHSPIQKSMRKLIGYLLCLLLLSASVVQAQIPPPPQGVSFTDLDPTARVFFRRVGSEFGRRQLDRHIERNPQDPRGWSARAFAKALTGDEAAAVTDLERANSLITGDSVRRREVLWSTGWIQLTLGHHDSAADAWVTAVKLHRGKPYWVPYSFSALAELAGQRDIALAWYAVAADDAPRRWGGRRAMTNMTRHWQARERDAIRRVYEAWAASNRP